MRNTPPAQQPTEPSFARLIPYHTKITPPTILCVCERSGNTFRHLSFAYPLNVDETIFMLPWIMVHPSKWVISPEFTKSVLVPGHAVKMKEYTILLDIYFFNIHICYISQRTRQGLYINSSQWLMLMGLEPASTHMWLSHSTTVLRTPK